jgi:hypothetical protein
MTSCGEGNNSPFCVCTDYYGDDIPGYKAMMRDYDTVAGTVTDDRYSYFCQSDIISIKQFTKQIYTASTTDANPILAFARSFEKQYTNGDYVNAFFDETSKPYEQSNITTDDQFKTKMPLLYYETLLLYSLMATVNVPSSITNTTYTCAAGEQPVYLRYGSYFNRLGKEALVCMTDENIKKPIFFVNPDTKAATTEQVPYILYEVLDKDRKPCTDNTCDITTTDEFDIDNTGGHYIGNVLHKSSGNIQPPGTPSITIILLLGIVILGVVLYALYYLYMRRHHHEVISHMNHIKPGAGDHAASRASASKSANRHIMT